MDGFNDTEILRQLVNNNFTFGDLSPRFKNNYNANIFCPFHEHSFQGKGNAKMYYDEEKEIWVLACFVEHRVFTAYDYVDLILCKRQGKYSSVKDFLLQKLDKAEFISSYKSIQKNIDIYKETYYENKCRYIREVASEVEDLVDYIERLYTG